MSRLDRRRFLESSLAFAGAALAAPRPSLDFTPHRTPGPKDDRILVVVELSGGNDGLSMVVPHAEDAYHRARRQTRHRAETVLRLNDQVGLNPVMKRLHRAHGDGALTTVLGCGYPDPNRSHFESMDIWHAADPRGQLAGRGWLGRFADTHLAQTGEPNSVIAIGNATPLALVADRVKPVAFRDPQAYRFAAREGQKKAAGIIAKGKEKDPTTESDLDFLRRISRQAKSSSFRIRRAIRGHKTRANFNGGGRLGQDLRIAAALIARDLGTRVIYCSTGGFDTHVNQRNRHDNLMRQLDAALGAFRQELRAHGRGDRVVTMVFSEFGRRVQENASGGTDHGTAGPMLLMGESLKGGVVGAHPAFNDLDERGDLKMTTDFRQVYAGLIGDWMGADAKKLVGDYPTLPDLV